jgi:hypothetical protein
LCSTTGDISDFSLDDIIIAIAIGIRDQLESSYGPCALTLDLH